MESLRILALLLLCSSALGRQGVSIPGLQRNGTSRGRVLQAARGGGFWSVKGTEFIDAAGNVVKFSGITWSGLETPYAAPGGLQKRSLDSHLDQMAKLGFNMMRLPFAGATLYGSTYPQPGRVSASPELQGLSSLQVMDKVIEGCGKRGIKVILDYHRMHLTWENEIGTWWDKNTPESVWINNWASLAKRYKGNPTIIGADLFNEVHPNPSFPEGAPYWQEDAGENEAYNFRSATIRVINVIHPIEPNWILFMEGMWHGPYWWGGNVVKLLEAPITQPAGKLAYSAHDYGPFVAPLTWFFDPAFPKNLKTMFWTRWGQVIERGIAPVWVGEFGSFMPAPTNDLNYRETATFKEQVSYIGQIGASWTIAFWGPDTKDTGSILNGDWFTVNQAKMDLLAPLMHPGFV